LGLSKAFLTQVAIDALRLSDLVFFDVYTSLSCDLTPKTLSELIGREVRAANRDFLEAGSKVLLDMLEEGRTVSVATIGDPMIATTHVAVAVEAMKRGIEVKVIPGTSVFCYAISKSMLSSYKFGKSVTITYQGDRVDTTALRVIEFNYSQGLHTLTFLDLKDGRPMSLEDAFRMLRLQEQELGKSVLSQFEYVVVESRLGCSDESVKAISPNGPYDEAGAPPYVIIFPGRLHFMEVDALKCLRSKKG